MFFHKIIVSSIKCPDIFFIFFVISISQSITTELLSNIKFHKNIFNFVLEFSIIHFILTLFEVSFSQIVRQEIFKFLDKILIDISISELIKIKKNSQS